MLSQAAEGKSVVYIPEDKFKVMAQSLNDMQLTPSRQKDAETALKKIRCSRPEWKVGAKQFSNFNLSCD